MNETIISAFDMDGKWYADVVKGRQILHTTEAQDDRQSAEWTAEDWAIRNKIDQEYQDDPNFPRYPTH